MRGMLTTKTIGYQCVFYFPSSPIYCSYFTFGNLSRPKYHEFSIKLLIFPMLLYKDINSKTVIILFHLSIIQLTVYNRTITRFIADDNVVYQRVTRQMQLTSDNSWARRRLLQFNEESHELIGPLLACPPDWAQSPLLPNAVYHCLVVRQLYLSSGFSSADCRCFRVSKRCREIHSTTFVHHTALTDGDL